MRHVTLCALLLTPALPAGDPPVPPGGFPVKIQKDLPIVFSDNGRTLMNAYYPNVAPPATGWPTLLVLHGGGGNRNTFYVVETQRRFAKRGYLALAIDSRGGQSARVVRDIAEVYDRAKLALGGVMDSSRLAVTGKSAGGRRSLWAMSYSGKPLPLAGYVRNMPKLAACMPEVSALDSIADNVPGGVMVRTSWARTAFQAGGTNHPISQAIINGNYAQLITLQKQDVVADYYPRIRAQDVPLLMQYSWDDGNHQINLNGDLFPGMKAGVPRRFLVTTGGHGSPLNDVETALNYEAMLEWCDRFMKGIRNNADKKPFAEVAVIPSDVTRYQSQTSHWGHRTSDVWPASTPLTRFWLRQNGALAPQPPRRVESGPTLRHTVASGYNAVSFMRDRADLRRVGRSIPFVSVPFDGPATASEREIFGRAVCELEVTTNARSFQLQAALFDVPPSGAPRYITSGTVARRGVRPGRHRLRIELSDVCYILPAGHKIRVALENMAVRQHPGHTHFWVLPEFASSTQQVHIDTTFPPRVDVPFTLPSPLLTPRIARASAAAGVRHSVLVEGHTSRAGAFYQVFVTASGTWPGVTLPPRLPLNVDAWTLFGIATVNTPVFASFAGLLDGQGNATGTFQLSPSLARLVAGTRLDFAALLVSRRRALATSGAVCLVIDP